MCCTARRNEKNSTTKVLLLLNLNTKKKLCQTRGSSIKVAFIVFSLFICYFTQKNCDPHIFASFCSVK